MAAPADASQPPPLPHRRPRCPPPLSAARPPCGRPAGAAPPPVARWRNCAKGRRCWLGILIESPSGGRRHAGRGWAGRGIAPPSPPWLPRPSPGAVPPRRPRGRRCGLKRKEVSPRCARRGAPFSDGELRSPSLRHDACKASTAALHAFASVRCVSPSENKKQEKVLAWFLLFLLYNYYC